jgi:hypothetical protein
MGPTLTTVLRVRSVVGATAMAATALVVVPILTGTEISAAGMSKSEPTWFRAPGHYAYCAHAMAEDWLRCFSTVSGRWIRITNIRSITVVRVGKGNSERITVISNKRITTGRDPRLIGFRRNVPDSGKSLLYYDDRPGENSVVCSAVRVFFRCAVGGARFWFRPDGTFQLIR